MNFARLLAHLPPRTRLYLATVLYGLAGGGIAVAFHTGIHELYLHTFEAWAELAPETFMWRTLVLMLGVALLSGWLVKICPEAAGSGIPQLKLAFWKEFGWTSPRIMLVKFIAGVTSIGGGMSLGREGPSVQLAGVLGSTIAERLGVAKIKHRMPAAAGAAAGLAAAFNTPLAAVTFVLEEIIGDLNSRFLGNILMASVVGALVAHGLLGAEPAFNMDIPGESVSWVVYVVTPWAAACAALTGLLFQKSSLGLRQWSRQQRRVPGWCLPVIGALLTWVIGILVWRYTGHLGVFSLGYRDLSDALSGHLGWQIAFLLLVAKLAATILCYGCGGCGGIFSPTLFFGGMAGLAAAGVASLVVPLEGGDLLVLAVVGMCACLGAVVRAPVTGILIVFEMTHEFSLVLPLMLGVLVSQSISRRLERSNFYEAILEQDGHHLERIIPPRDLETWQQLPVSAIANFHPVVISDLSATTLKAAFDQHPFANFPVMQEGRLSGILTRREMEHALLTNTPVDLEPAISSDPRESIVNIQTRLLESNAGIVVLTDEKDTLLGVVTLHDLLRAQMAYGKGLEQG
ncbi:chloride channel protein, CIC family [Prosthecobacter debontii]|uniref:Chloride channel protein, CIC family n=1 Tax=Prosthecobacter debontii TaxID=48467 RepID=A0A1T4WGK3_9BACT|nr:chloride channel protein [Prosthecobacter debontii]SKA76299.1 chloride channel protein, CIC family [Prosthecobacter debontii]